MTKFTKGVLTTGILLAVGVGGYKFYQYADETGLIDKIRNSYVPEETRVKLEDFLKADANLGFVQINYDILNINKLTDEQIFDLISNPYETKDGKLVNNGIANTKLFKKLGGTIRENIKDPKICFKTSEVKKVLLELTNQTYKNKNEKLCVPSITRYNIKHVNLKVKNAKHESNGNYIVNYTLTPVDNFLYIQDKNYEGMDIYDHFDGTVTLGVSEDGRYYYVSNNYSKGTNLEYSK